MTAFDYVQCQGGATHQVHDNVEDAFIDEMAMGPLLWKDFRHRMLAGSVEGLVAELIQVSVVISFFLHRQLYHYCRKFIVDCSILSHTNA